MPGPAGVLSCLSRQLGGIRLLLFPKLLVRAPLRCTRAFGREKEQLLGLRGPKGGRSHTKGAVQPVRHPALHRVSLLVLCSRGGSARKETAVRGLDGEEEAGFGVELTESAWQVTDSRDPSELPRLRSGFRLRAQTITPASQDRACRGPR